MYTTNNLLDLEHTLAKDYLSKFKYPWQALSGIKEEIIRIGKTLDKNEYDEVKENVWVHKTATVFESAYLGAPLIIGPNSEVRHCAFIRGSALVGANCVVGNSCELKNVILGDHVEVGCNSVLNPGTVVGRNTNIYPLSRVRGVIPSNSIYKDSDNIVGKN